MSMADMLKTLNDVLKTYHILDQRLKTIEADFKQLDDEFKQIRLEHLKIEGRVARLEESRETIKAEMRAELADALRGASKEFNEAKSRLEIEYIKAWADFQIKMSNRPASSSPMELPSAEKPSDA